MRLQQLGEGQQQLLPFVELLALFLIYVTVDAILPKPILMFTAICNQPDSGCM